MNGPDLRVAPGLRGQVQEIKPDFHPTTREGGGCEPTSPNDVGGLVRRIADGRPGCQTACLVVRSQGVEGDRAHAVNASEPTQQPQGGRCRFARCNAVPAGARHAHAAADLHHRQTQLGVPARHVLPQCRTVFRHRRVSSRLQRDPVVRVHRSHAPQVESGSRRCEMQTMDFCQDVEQRSFRGGKPGPPSSAVVVATSSVRASETPRLRPPGGRSNTQTRAVRRWPPANVCPLKAPAIPPPP
jgi:hypothetical protein